MSRPNGLNRGFACYINVRHRQALRRINASKGASQGGSPCGRHRYIKGISRAYKGIGEQSGKSQATSGSRTQGARKARNRKRRTSESRAGGSYGVRREGNV